MTISRAPPPTAAAIALLLEERPRERRDDQRDRRRAQQQQGPVADPPPAHGLIGNAPHEHQRRKLDDALPLALNQVDQIGTAMAPRPTRKEGVRKDIGIRDSGFGESCDSRQRTRISRSRLDR